MSQPPIVRVKGPPRQPLPVPSRSQPIPPSQIIKPQALGAVQDPNPSHDFTGHFLASSDLDDYDPFGDFDSELDDIAYSSESSQNESIEIPFGSYDNGTLFINDFSTYKAILSGFNIDPKKVPGLVILPLKDITRIRPPSRKNSKFGVIVVLPEYVNDPRSRSYTQLLSGQLYK